MLQSYLYHILKTQITYINMKKETYLIIKNEVKQLLIDYPDLRDNKNKLVWIMINNELIKSIPNLDKYNYITIMELLEQGQVYVPDFETIRRSWQKIQEENPHLRGKDYLKRQHKAEEVKQYINK